MKVVDPPAYGLTIGAGTRIVKAVRGQSRHHHTFFELLCISEGHTRVRIRGTEVEAGPGDLLIYYPEEDHEEFVQAGRWSHIWLRFDAKMLKPPVAFPSQRRTAPLVHLPWPERFQNLFAQMIVEQRMKDRWSRVLMNSYLAQFVALLHRALDCIGSGTEGRTAERSMRISKAIELIHAGLDEDLSLGELAAESAMSESHFSHTFKAMTGVAPKKYMVKAKMLKARELLATTDQSVKAIAMTLGYEDPHYFSKVFRKTSGQTPSAFRAAAAGARRRARG